MNEFGRGDVVRILDDIAQVHSLQEDHGGWVDDMALVGDCNLYILANFSSSMAVAWTSWSYCNDLPLRRHPGRCKWNDVDV